MGQRLRSSWLSSDSSEHLERWDPVKAPLEQGPCLPTPRREIDASPQGVWGVVVWTRQVCAFLLPKRLTSWTERKVPNEEVAKGEDG